MEKDAKNSHGSAPLRFAAACAKAAVVILLLKEEWREMQRLVMARTTMVSASVRKLALDFPLQMKT